MEEALSTTRSPPKAIPAIPPRMYSALFTGLIILYSSSASCISSLDRSAVFTDAYRKIANKIKNKIPAALPRQKLSVPSMIFLTEKSESSRSSITVMKMENGNSFFKRDHCACTGFTSAQHPSTTSRLNILEPSTLLTARSFFPLNAAVTLTESSGRLVPNATTVRPMIMGGTFRIFATLELPSTKKSAPLINNTNPKNSNR